jgi:hypothetical protein
MGRIAFVKMHNIVDAMALYTNEVKIELPVIGSKQGSPIIHPTKGLIDFIENYSNQNTNVDLSTTGFIN